MTDYRKAYGLPERYFLSLGRMVEKKNLATLIAAYAKFCDGWREPESAEMALRQTSGESGPDGAQRSSYALTDCEVAAPPQAEETGDRKQSEAFTRDKLPATRNSIPALVFVGSGELEGALREQARALGSRVVDRTDWRVNGREEAQEGASPKAEKLKYGKAETTGGEDPHSHEENCGTVFFYGFRQIEENPVFYALADAFVLPSLKEEWGLVVNEAMACSLPVIVSRTAGCAEDLVPASGSVEQGAGSMESGEGKETDDCKLTTDDSLEERSNGFVFDPKSSDALCEALRRIAVAGEKLKVKGNDLEGMGQRSREIVAKFSCENFAQQALRAAEAAGA